MNQHICAAANCRLRVVAKLVCAKHQYLVRLPISNDRNVGVGPERVAELRRKFLAEGYKGLLP